jgi:hypothetical protein
MTPGSRQTLSALTLSIQLAAGCIHARVQDVKLDFMVYARSTIALEARFDGPVHRVYTGCWKKNPVGTCEIKTRHDYASLFSQALESSIVLAKP